MEISEMAKLLLENALRLNKTIEKYLLYTHLQFLNFSKDKLGNIKNSNSEISNQIVKSLIESKVTLLGRDNDLKLNIENSQIAIHTDYLDVLIEQIANNCFDYSLKGTPVEIIGKITGNKYELIFCDKGRGMSEKQIAEVGGFMQFDRNIYEQQGTGMGLSISKQIVKIFDGQFEIKSELGKGTTLQVSFPLA
jgi:signal transduction histidine kinase